MMSKTVSAEAQTRPNIKVVAIGGGAINAQNHMIDCGMQGLDFIAVGTDAIGVKLSKAPTKILIGEKRLRGLGMLPMPVCRKIAEEMQDNIKRNLDGSDIVFVVTCMGGNTGSGVAPIVASCAHEIGALTIAVITTPFSFEGTRRRKRAETGMNEMKENVNALITISNDSLLHHLDKNTSLVVAFQVSDDAIHRSVQKVSELLSIPGLVNIDFNDVQPPQFNGEENDSKENQILGGIQWLGKSQNDVNQEITKKFASQLDRGTLGWLRSNEKEEQKHTENLLPRTDGKAVCAYLRGIRNDLAKANNIPFESEPCDFKGDCAGTCEKCDQEASYLRNELDKIPNQERKYPQHILKDWKKALCSEK